LADQAALARRTLKQEWFLRKEQAMSQSSSPPTRTWLAITFIAIGLLLVLGSIFADSLGATWGGDGYGWKQLLATIAGLIVGLTGVGIWMKSLTPPR
jgi:hypothetical protein